MARSFYVLVANLTEVENWLKGKYKIKECHIHVSLNIQTNLPPCEGT